MSPAVNGLVLVKTGGIVVDEAVNAKVFPVLAAPAFIKTSDVIGHKATQ